MTTAEAMTTETLDSHGIRPSDDLEIMEQCKQRKLNKKLSDAQWQRADGDVYVACEQWVRKERGMLAGFLRLDDEGLPEWQPTNDWGGDVFLFRTQAGAARSMDSDYGPKIPLDNTIVPAVLLFDAGNINEAIQHDDIESAPYATPRPPAEVGGRLSEPPNAAFHLMRLQVQARQWMRVLDVIADMVSNELPRTPVEIALSNVNEELNTLQQFTQKAVSEIIGGWTPWQADAMEEEQQRRQDAIASRGGAV